MPTKIITWSWQEAFDKFGFEDGDGLVMTDVVEAVLWDAGYSVTAEPWDSHNVVISSIKDATGNELIPSTVSIGYDDPRSYLPKTIVALLDFDPRTGDAATQALSSTSIIREHRRAFEALLAGGTGFALVSCFVNATPTAAIVAMTEEDNGDICIAPLFVAVTDDMTLTDHSGTPAHADAAMEDVRS